MKAEPSFCIKGSCQIRFAVLFRPAHDHHNSTCQCPDPRSATPSGRMGWTSPCPDANTRLLLRVRQNRVPARGAMCTDTIPSSSKKNGNRLATSTNCVGFTCVLSRGLNFQTPHSILSWTCLNSRHCRSSYDTPKKPTNHTLSHSDEALQICAKTHVDEVRVSLIVSKPPGTGDPCLLT